MSETTEADEFFCHLCGRLCDGLGEALQCCSERFEETVATDGGHTEAEAWVLEEVRSNTAPEPDGRQDAESAIWTGHRRIVGNTDKPGQPARDEIRDGIATLRARGEIITWHGLLAPTTEDHLRAVIENERLSDIPRRPLIGRANQLLQGTVPAVLQGGTA